MCYCRWKLVDHYVSRVRGAMQLLQQQDVIGRTSELARVFGIQFLHVLTRGSQVRHTQAPDLFPLTVFSQTFVLVAHIHVFRDVSPV